MQFTRRHHVGTSSRRRAALIGLAAAALTLGWAAPSDAHPVAFGHAGVTPVAAAIPAAGMAAEDDVYAVRQEPDGSLSVDHWTPAAGVSADALRSALRAQGIQGIVSSARALPPGGDVDPNSGKCTPWIDGAAFGCSGYWKRNGFSDPQVYFLDHTPAAWPVSQARSDWYAAPQIDAYYRWYTDGCPGGGRHCVNVSEVNLPTSGWYGYTHLEHWSDGTLKDGTAYVQLNKGTMKDANGAPLPATAYRAVTCHEMGHALGLAHNNQPTSCLSVTGNWDEGQHPAYDDLLVLQSFYLNAPS